MRKFFVIVFIFLVVGVGSALAVFYENKESRLFFVGDVSFDRHIRAVAEKNGGDFLFSCIGEFLKEADLVIGNLEGPITEKASVSKGSVIGSPQNFTFTFPTSSAKLLYKNNIKLVNLGNNHIDDFGKEGFESTQKYLHNAGVKYFGGAFGEEDVFYKKIGGITFAFISYNQFGGEPATKIADKIKKEKQNGKKVIVYTHWGEEYISPNQSIKNTASLFAENGADFVIGSHPHVILERSRVGETVVYYSLGNFIFDQYWDSRVSTGLVLELNIKNKNISIVEHKVNIGRDGRTCLAN